MSEADLPERASRLLGAVTIVLTAAAGSLNAVTFFAFNGVFASTTTGNLILLGLDISRGRWVQTVEALCAVSGYAVGLAAGTLLVGVAMRRLPWRNSVGAALTTELAILVLLGLGWFGLDAPGHATLRLVLLVTGAGLAMGVQAAAMRHVGPAGTPTNFLTGTVTNWIATMVDLRQPRWDSNAALRVLAMVGSAGVGAVIESRAPALTYVLPVAMVALAIGMMARVTRAHHGGLLRGEPQRPTAWNSQQWEG